MDAIPHKGKLGNTLIFEPSGRIHFVNLETNDYFWKARTDIAPYKLVKAGSDYFGFKESDNDLFYFHRSGHKMIDCDMLETELANINKGRKKGNRFNCDEPIESTFWLDFSTGEFCNAQEAATRKFDMFEIHRRFYHIWHDDKKQMDVHFWRVEKCIGPCVCKSIHVEADYVQREVEKHRLLRNRHEFALQFRDYLDLVLFEHSLKGMPDLEKDDLIVYPRTLFGDKLYKGLFLGHIPVVAKELDANHNRRLLVQNLKELNKIKHFVQFHGIFVSEKRHYLVFDDFELVDRRKILSLSEDELLDDLKLSKDELLANLKGLIRGVAYMQELGFNADMWGNISASSVVITDDLQKRLKIFIPGLGVAGKTKTHDRKGLAELINSFKAVFPIPEFLHLVQCLRKTERNNLRSLIEHPIFWTAFERLDFVVSFFEVMRRNSRLCAALSYIKAVVENAQTGDIDYEFFWAMESYATYALGIYQSKVGQLVRMIRHAKIHDLDLPNDVRKLYGESRLGLEKYFKDRYPKLFFELYKLVQKECPKHDHFAQFTILEL